MSGQSDKMATTLSSRNGERGVPWWHSSLVVVVTVALLGDDGELVS